VHKDRHPVLTEIEGLFLRWIAATGLVFATYNPSEFCYVHWAQNSTMDNAPYVIFVGLILAVGFAIFFRAIRHSLGLVGLALVLALLGSGIWSLTHLGLIDFGNHSTRVYVVLISLATTMAIGLDWSILRRRISGQVDVEN